MLQGSLVALVTPMKQNGAVDYDTIEALVNWQIEAGIQGIVAVGTTGESATLTPEEQARVIETVVCVVNKRVPVIAGTGTHCTAKTIANTRQAKRLGVDACLLVTPYYNRPSQAGLYAHYRAVAEAVNVPQILYNVPGRTGCDLLPETAAKLSYLPGIIAIKEAVGRPERHAALRAQIRGRIQLLSGDDDSCARFVLEGGDGVISVAANVVPDKMRGLMDAALAGDEAKTMRLNEKLASLFATLGAESNPIPVKWLLQDMGRVPAGLRLPLTSLAKRYQAGARTALTEAQEA